MTLGSGGTAPSQPAAASDALSTVYAGQAELRCPGGRVSKCVVDLQYCQPLMGRSRCNLIVS